MRRLLAAFAVLSVAEWGFVTAVGIQAYRVGGALAVGLVGFRFFFGAVSSAVLAPLVDGRPRVLTMIAALRFLLLGLGAASVLAGLGLWVVVALVAIDAVVAAPYRPAQSGLIPSLARAPAEVSAAVAGVSMFKTLGQAAGAFLGGIGTALVAPGSVMAGAAGAMGVAAALTYGIDQRTSARRRTTGTLLAGLEAIPRVFGGAASPLVIASGLRTFVRGLWTSLVVVVALQLFALGGSGVGVLTGAAGIGAALALPVTASLIGRRHLAVPCALAFVFAGLSLSAVGVLPNGEFAAVVLCGWGAAMAIADATSLSLLHRLLDAPTVSRTVGVMESLKLGLEGIGALVAPALVGLFGVRTALILAGLPLPLTIVLSLTRLSSADTTAAGRAALVSLLHRVATLGGLDMASLEDLAGRARRIVLPPYTNVVTQGEPGEDFYVIEHGKAEVLLDGYWVGELGRGAGFGERALLRATPRAATVRTLSTMTAYAIDRANFLAALTGQPPEAVVDVGLVELSRRDQTSRPLSQVLGDVTLLSRLDHDELDDLAQRATIEVWKPGETIIRERDTASAMYVVLSGKAHTTIGGNHVRDVLPGDSFGEIAIVHQIPRQATVAAAEELHTCRVTAQALAEIGHVAIPAGARSG
jgi:CRP-like cAMP-binding protein